MQKKTEKSLLRNAEHSTTLDYISAYTPLVLSLFYFVGISSDTSSTHIMVLIFVYAIHLFLHHHIITQGGRGKEGWAMAITIVLCFAASSINPSSYAFYWYTVYFAALHFSVRRALMVCGVIVALVVLSAQLFNYWVYWYFLPALVPGVAMFGHGYYEKKSLEFAEAQRQSQQELEQLAKVAERERIARDLHDVMGHNLATIALKAQLAEKQGRAGKIEDAMNEIAEVSKITSETLSEMRAVISGYKFRSIEHHADKLERSLEDAGFKVKNSLNLPEVNAKTESTIALILTEAVTNILKHSNGDAVTLSCREVPLANGVQQLQLHISDNGKVKKLSEGNGLQGMRERISELNGSLEMSFEKGIELSINIPSADTEQENDQNIIG